MSQTTAANKGTRQAQKALARRPTEPPPAAPPPVPTPAAPARHWHAELSLGFRRSGPRTCLVQREHVGPLGVQRGYYPEPDGTCHVYLLHPPGGIAGGDELEIAARLQAGSHALVTTPAATKLYAGFGRAASQGQSFRIAGSAALEWLPQETIVFDGADAALHTRVQLEADSKFMGWEILCLGRPACGERFETGRLRQSFEVFREGEPLFIERARYRGGADLLRAAYGLGGAPVIGTLVCVASDAHGEQRTGDLASAVREGTRACAGQFAVTQLRDVLVCRFLGTRTEDALIAFRAAWSILRRRSWGRPAYPPRIWST